MTLQPDVKPLHDLNPVRYGFALAAQRNIDLATLLSRLEVLRLTPPAPTRPRAPAGDTVPARDTVPADVERLTPTIVDAAAALCALSEALASGADGHAVPDGWPVRVPAATVADAATALALAASLLDLIIADCLAQHDELAPGIPQRLRNGRRLLRDGVLADLEAVLDAETGRYEGDGGAAPAPSQPGAGAAA